jgi:hypothetical protein
MRWQIFFLGLVFTCANTSSLAVNPVLGQLEFIPSSKIEGDAGVWIDGQYVGFVKALRGADRLVLLPGEHSVRLQLLGYQDLESTVVIEPGTKKRYRVKMAETPNLTYPEREETARLRFLIQPEDAAIFMDDVFVGHVDRFNGVTGMRVAAGTYRFTIGLPGHEPFKTELTVRAGQTYEIKTDLQEGDLNLQGDALSAGERTASESQ